MQVTVLLPRLVAEACSVPRDVAVVVDGDTADVSAVVAGLTAMHPGVRRHLLDDRGRLRANVLCAVDDIRTRLDMPTPVTDGSTVRFVPSVAGG